MQLKFCVNVNTILEVIRFLVMTAFFVSPCIYLNRSLQGFFTSIFSLTNRTDAFKKKLALWDNFVQKVDTEMLPSFNDFSAGVDVKCQRLITKCISQLLKELDNNFD